SSAVKHDAATSPLRFIGEGLCEFGKVGACERGDRKGNQATGPRAHLLCTDLRSVVELPNRLLDTIPGPGADIGAIIDHVGDRLHRYPELLGDVTHGHVTCTQLRPGWERTRHFTRSRGSRVALTGTCVRYRLSATGWRHRPFSIATLGSEPRLDD